MADCWSCGAERREEVFCGACGKIQPLAKSKTHFDVLDVPRRMRQDRAEIDKAFRVASKLVHPDRFGAASSIERRLALEHTARLNEAYRAVSDPERRAEYLMSLEGVVVGSETARTTDQAFLMEMLELSEEVHALRDPEILREKERALSARRRTLSERVEDYFDRQEGTLRKCVNALDELRYLRRLQEQITAKLEE